MQSISIQFYVELPGAEYSDVSFSDTSPEFKNIRLVACRDGDGSHHVLVEKFATSCHPQSIRPLVDESMREARLFIYAFSAATEQKFFNFRCIGYLVNGQLHPLKSLSNKAGLGFILRAEMVVNKGEESIRRIKEWMSKLHDYTKVHLFFSASSITDPVSRYLSLYTALLHVYGDEQRKVDDAILSIDPTVQQSRQPHRPAIFETVFSRLRNEISHFRPGCSLPDTHEEIIANVDRFEAIVRRIMIS